MRNTSFKRISGYGIAIATVLGSTSTKGAIVHLDVNPPNQTGSDLNNGSVLLSFSLTGVIATNGTHVASEQFFATHTHSVSGGSQKMHFYANGGTLATFDYRALASGTLIGAGQESDPTSTGAVLIGFKSPWSPGQQAYLGLKFDNAGAPAYGWAQLITVDAHTITLQDMAYENNGGPIAAGSLLSVPEPSQLALFAIGAAGIAAYRRRKQFCAASC